MNSEIYYFSGTGNSIHIAKELQKRIPETDLKPIVSLCEMDNIKTSGEIVGFIFPIHLAMAPYPIIIFLKKLDMKSAKYIYAIATRGGSQHRAFIDIQKILNKKDKNLDSFFNLNMASNDPKFEKWHQATEDEIANFESEVQKSLEDIQNIIINKEKNRKKDTNFTVHMPLFSILSHFLPILNGLYNIDFYNDSKCVGCGTCEKVCLSGKIRIKNSKPLWDTNISCFFCHACLNYCPEQSIQIKSNRFLKSYTTKNGRYFHPDVTVEDIATQKFV